jgi:Flp pilus assembly protein TadG
MNVVIGPSRQNIALLSRRSKRVPPRQQGQAAVEIALILPLLLIVLFGIIMSAFVFYAYIQVTNAAREGARAGSVYRVTHPTTSWTMDQTVKFAIYTSSSQNALGGLATSSSNPRVNVTYSTMNSADCSKDSPCAGDLVTSTVTYSYTIPVLSDFLQVFPQPVVLQSTVMMVIQ